MAASAIPAPRSPNLDGPLACPATVASRPSLALSILLRAAARDGARGSNTSRPITPSTSIASRCGTACGSSPRSTSPRTRSKPHPIVMTRTPYSVAPYGIDRYRENLGPSPLFGKAGYIVAYQDVRGPLPLRGDVRGRPAADPRQEGAEGHRREQRHVRHDRLAGEERPEQQRQGRDLGHLLPRLLRRGRR